MTPQEERPYRHRVPRRPMRLVGSRPLRRTIWYVTIDEADYMAEPSTRWTHQPNLDRLREIAASTTPALEVEPQYFIHITPSSLQEPSVFALFLAGSWPEWITARKRRDWGRALERFCTLIRSTTIPIFAVCGSHQLVAKAYAGWDAIAHMIHSEDGPAPTVAREMRSGKSLIPHYRVGEVGAFPMAIPSGAHTDPILRGFTAVPYFMEYHHDEVLESARSQLFDALLRPARDAPAIQDHTVRIGQGAHAPVKPADRCEVQLLKLRSADRVLYTSQFHPELSCRTVHDNVAADISGNEALYFQADANGERLLHNFFSVARDFWQHTGDA